MAQPVRVTDDGTGMPDIPKAPCTYRSCATPWYIIDGLPPGSTIEIDVVWSAFDCGSSGHCGMPGGSLGGETNDWTAILNLNMNGTGDLAGFSRQINLPVNGQNDTAPRAATPVQMFDNDLFQMDGALFGDPDFATLQISAGALFGLPSPGETTLQQFPDGRFQVDSFFDVAYAINFVGAPGGSLEGLSGTTSSSCEMNAGEPADVAQAPDNGTGTADVPPPSSIYRGLNMIIEDGLPAGSTIEITPRFHAFTCPSPSPCAMPGGSLNGQIEPFAALVDLTMQGTGSLAGFVRTIVLISQGEVHSAPRVFPDTVQTFATGLPFKASCSATLISTPLSCRSEHNMACHHRA